MVRLVFLINFSIFQLLFNLKCSNRSVLKEEALENMSVRKTSKFSHFNGFFEKIHYRYSIDHNFFSMTWR